MITSLTSISFKNNFGHKELLRTSPYRYDDISLYKDGDGRYVPFPVVTFVRFIKGEIFTEKRKKQGSFNSKGAQKLIPDLLSFFF